MALNLRKGSRIFLRAERSNMTAAMERTILFRGVARGNLAQPVGRTVAAALPLGWIALQIPTEIPTEIQTLRISAALSRARP